MTCEGVHGRSTRIGSPGIGPGAPWKAQGPGLRTRPKAPAVSPDRAPGHWGGRHTGPRRGRAEEQGSISTIGAVGAMEWEAPRSRWAGAPHSPRACPRRPGRPDPESSPQAAKKKLTAEKDPPAPRGIAGASSVPNRIRRRGEALRQIPPPPKAVFPPLYRTPCGIRATVEAEPGDGGGSDGASAPGADIR